MICIKFSPFLDVGDGRKWIHSFQEIYAECVDAILKASSDPKLVGTTEQFLLASTTSAAAVQELILAFSSYVLAGNMAAPAAARETPLVLSLSPLSCAEHCP
jgi:hypothetical protein